MQTYYVYKFRIKGTGFFYIGVTTNVSRRRSTHVSRLNATMNAIRFDALNPLHGREGYVRVARYILKGRRLLSRKNCLDKDKCIMEVLATVRTPSETARIEGQYLLKYKNYSKCFNILNQSAYCYEAKDLH